MQVKEVKDRLFSSEVISRLETHITDIKHGTCNFFSSCLFLFPLEGLRPETKNLLSSTSKKKGKGGSKGEEEPKTESQPISIHLHFKRYVFDPHKKMIQS